MSPLDGELYKERYEAKSSSSYTFTRFAFLPQNLCVGAIRKLYEFPPLGLLWRLYYIDVLMNLLATHSRIPILTHLFFEGFMGVRLQLSTSIQVGFPGNLPPSSGDFHKLP